MYFLGVTILELFISGYNIDIMHVEKNFFNLFYILMELKNKDDPKSRQDAALYCARRELELITKGNKA